MTNCQICNTRPATGDIPHSGFASYLAAVCGECVESHGFEGFTPYTTGQSLWTVVARRTGGRFFRTTGTPAGTWQEATDRARVYAAAHPELPEVWVTPLVPLPGDEAILTLNGKRVPIRWDRAI